MLAVDISNYGGKASIQQNGVALLPSTVQRWRDNGISRVIVGVHEIQIARDQLQVSVDGGLEPQVYCQMYWGREPLLSRDTILHAIEGFPVRRIWLAFEDKSAPVGNPELVCRWIRHCLDVFSLPVICPDGPGVYTAPWWWVPWTGNTGLFNHYPLWVAQYDDIPDLSFSAFGGWQSCSMKQYTNTIDLCGYSVDKNYYEEDNDSMDEETKNKVARIALLQRWAGMIQSGDDSFENRVYQEMKYIRQLAGKSV
jgi:hypothetical protein